MLAAGPSSIATIARDAGIYRTDVYAALPELETLGLLAKTGKGRRMLYAAAPVGRLLELAEARLARAAKVLQGAVKEEKRETRARGPIRALKGPAGLSEVLADMMRTLPRGGTFYRIDSHLLRPRKGPSTTMPAGYGEWRDKNRIEQFVITSGTLRTSSFRKRLECASRVIPPKEDGFGYDINVLIHGDTVAFVDFTDETAFLITHPRIAAMQKSLFKRLYDRLQREPGE